jgi:hypothetical protein
VSRTWRRNAHSEILVLWSARTGITSVRLDLLYGFGCQCWEHGYGKEASDTLLAGGAISESWRVLLSQDRHDGISDQKTRIPNSLWQDLQTYP